MQMVVNIQLGLFVADKSTLPVAAVNEQFRYTIFVCLRSTNCLQTAAGYWTASLLKCILNIYALMSCLCLNCIYLVSVALEQVLGTWHLNEWLCMWWVTLNRRTLLEKLGWTPFRLDWKFVIWINSNETINQPILCQSCQSLYLVSN